MDNQRQSKQSRLWSGHFSLDKRVFSPIWWLKQIPHAFHLRNIRTKKWWKGVGARRGRGVEGIVESRDHGSTHIRWVTCTSLVCLNDYQPTQTFISLLSNLKISCLTWRVICILERGEVREEGPGCADIRDPPQRRRRVSCIYIHNAECRNRSCVRHTETGFSRGTAGRSKKERETIANRRKYMNPTAHNVWFFNLVKRPSLTPLESKWFKEIRPWQGDNVALLECFLI